MSAECRFESTVMKNTLCSASATCSCSLTHRPVSGGGTRTENGTSVHILSSPSYSQSIEGEWVWQKDGGQSWCYRVFCWNAVSQFEGIHVKNNGIRDLYRINFINFEATPMKCLRNSTILVPNLLIFIFIRRGSWFWHSDHIVESVIESSLRGIIGSKNFALIYLSLNLCEMTIYDYKIFLENFVAVH